MANKSLADVTSAAQALLEQIQSKGINAADRSAIVESAKQLNSLLDDLQPHVNDAHTAFGNQADNKTKIMNLRNQLAKIITTYSS